jgi:5'(3')-deoxyribonucleotidase
MGKMKIACDLDDVIFDFVPGFCEFYKEHSGRSFSKKDFYSYDFWEIIGGTREEAIRLVDEFYDSEYFDVMETVRGAKEGFTIIKENYDGLIITARPRRFKPKTKASLNDIFHRGDLKSYYSKGEYDEAVSKGDICLREKVSLLIEDNIPHVLDCERKGVSVLLLDNPWNKDFDERAHTRIKRVYDWDHILREIKNLPEGGHIK